jgi:two-component system phosphate regulon response regulator PhoB
LRSIVFRYEDTTALCRALDDGDGNLPMPPHEIAKEGEWVLALFEIGAKRRSTAAAARTDRKDDGFVLTFEPRDWERLVSFSAARSEHLRASRPAESRPRLDGFPEDEITSSALRADPPPPASATSSGRFPAAVTARVLLVDDDGDTRDVVGGMLEAVGLTVELASTAEEALQKVDRGGFDLLVLDWTLPGMSGVELCRQLRGQAKHAALPVLFLSGHSSSKDIVDAFASGADDFVVKPFRAPELGARIFSLLRRAKLARGSEHPAGQGNG